MPCNLSGTAGICVCKARLKEFSLGRVFNLEVIPMRLKKKEMMMISFMLFSLFF